MDEELEVGTFYLISNFINGSHIIDVNNQCFAIFNCSYVQYRELASCISNLLFYVLSECFSKTGSPYSYSICSCYM